MDTVANATAYALFPEACEEQGPDQVEPEAVVFAAELDVSHALSSEEWQRLGDVPRELVGEWLADTFSVRVVRWETDSMDPAATTPQGDPMHLRALTLLLASASLLLPTPLEHGFTSTDFNSDSAGGNDAHAVLSLGSSNGGQEQGQRDNQESLQGSLEREVRRGKDATSRSPRLTDFGATVQRLSRAETLRQPACLLGSMPEVQAEDDLRPSLRQSRSFQISRPDCSGCAGTTGDSRERSTLQQPSSRSGDSSGCGREELPPETRADSEGKEQDAREGAQAKGRHQEDRRPDRGHLRREGYGHAALSWEKDPQGRSDTGESGRQGLTAGFGWFMEAGLSSRRRLKANADLLVNLGNSKDAHEFEEGHFPEQDWDLLVEPEKHFQKYEKATLHELHPGYQCGFGRGLLPLCFLGGLGCPGDVL